LGDEGKGALGKIRHLGEYLLTLASFGLIASLLVIIKSAPYLGFVELVGGVSGFAFSLIAFSLGAYLFNEPLRDTTPKNTGPEIDLPEGIREYWTKRVAGFSDAEIEELLKHETRRRYLKALENEKRRRLGRKIKTLKTH
jgi:hypothetical protein